MQCNLVRCHRNLAKRMADVRAALRCDLHLDRDVLWIADEKADMAISTRMTRSGRGADSGRWLDCDALPRWASIGGIYPTSYRQEIMKCLAVDTSSYTRPMPKLTDNSSKTFSNSPASTWVAVG